GLYISANHVYGISGWKSRKAQFFDLGTENPGIFETSQIPPPEGNIGLGNMLIADFPLMHFDIAASASNTTLLPAEDFYLGIIDNQRTQQSPLSKHPEPVTTAVPLKLYDPENRTKANQTWNVAAPGEQAIAVGYPQDINNYPNGAVVYGRILSDAEAQAVIQSLKSVGDVEGNIPYDSAVEFFIASQAIAGMSGGGVFNSTGQLLGIMVRSSDAEKAPKITRVVKLTYIREKMVSYFNSLSQTDQSKIRPFISGELQ
ncbi:MAG: serine protease, partial [Sphingobacteriaceae bacterium]